MKKEWKRNELKCKTAFTLMGLVLPVWRSGLDDIQMERGIYHGCGNRPTPWISEEAYHGPKDKHSADHCFPVQFCGMFALDNPDPWLTDYEKFCELFDFASTVVIVSKRENKLLSGQTKKKKGILTLKCRMQEKYDTAGIKLLNKVTGVSVDKFPLKVWPEIWEYETQFLIDNSSNL